MALSLLHIHTGTLGWWGGDTRLTVYWNEGFEAGRGFEGSISSVRRGIL